MCPKLKEVANTNRFMMKMHKIKILGLLSRSRMILAPLQTGDSSKNKGKMKKPSSKHQRKKPPALKNYASKNDFRPSKNKRKKLWNRKQRELSSNKKSSANSKKKHWESKEKRKIMKNSVLWQKRSKRFLQMYHLVLLTNWSSSKGFSTFWSFLSSSPTSCSKRLFSFSNPSITLFSEWSAFWHLLCPWCSSIAFCRLAKNRRSSQMRSYRDDLSSTKKMRQLSTRCFWSCRSYRKISPIFKNKVAKTRLEAKGFKVSDLILHLWPLSWIRLDNSRVMQGICRHGL